MPTRIGRHHGVHCGNTNGLNVAANYVTTGRFCRATIRQIGGFWPKTARTGYGG